jgi:hypothetical protein
VQNHTDPFRRIYPLKIAPATQQSPCLNHIQRVAPYLYLRGTSDAILTSDSRFRQPTIAKAIRSVLVPAIDGYTFQGLWRID